MTGRAAENGPGSRDDAPSRPVPPRPPADAGRADDTNGTPTGTLRRVVCVVNPLGLHMRAADRFARAAKQHPGTVAVWNGEAHADGKDLWALIILAVPPGTDLILEVGGPDAADALGKLAEILGDPNGEDYAI